MSKMLKYKQEGPCQRDAERRPKCFFCNNYRHVKKHGRKWNNQTQKQNVQVQLADNGYWVDLSEN